MPDKLRIIVYGDACAGKTSLLKKIKFSEAFSFHYQRTIGFQPVIYHHDEHQVALEFFDIGGMEKYNERDFPFYFQNNIQAVFYCVSPSLKSNVTDLETNFQRMKACLPPDVKIYLILTKMDYPEKDRFLSEDTLKQFLKQHPEVIGPYRTSACTKRNEDKNWHKRIEAGNQEIVHLIQDVCTDLLNPDSPPVRQQLPLEPFKPSWSLFTTAEEKSSAATVLLIATVMGTGMLMLAAGLSPLTLIVSLLIVTMVISGSLVVTNQNEPPLRRSKNA